jgi:hypothetical protein
MGLCKLYVPFVLYRQITSLEFDIYKKQTSDSQVNTNGLVNYWTIVSGSLNDYVGQSHMFACQNVALLEDRFKQPNSAVFMNSGYCKVPAGVYFNSPFTIITWAYLIKISLWARLLDFGNGASNDNVLFALCVGNSTSPQLQIYKGSNPKQVVNPNCTLNLKEWTHLAGVYNGSHLLLYFNGSLCAAASTTQTPSNVTRRFNYIGHSNWNDQDLISYLDDIKIYNRALSSNEIRQDYFFMP